MDIDFQLEHCLPYVLRAQLPRHDYRFVLVLAASDWNILQLLHRLLLLLCLGDIPVAALFTSRQLLRDEHRGQLTRGWRPF